MFANPTKILLFLGITAASLFMSCGKDNTPLVVTETFNIGSMDDLEKATGEVKRFSPSRTVINVTGNLGLTKENKSLMNIFVTWSDWIKEGNVDTELNTGNFHAFPTEKILLTAQDIDWIKIIPISANTNGMMFYVDLYNIASFYLAGLDHLVQLDIDSSVEYGDAIVIVCNNRSELMAKIDEVKTALGLPGDRKVVLVMNGVYPIDNPAAREIDKLLVDPKLLKIDGTGASILPATDSVHVANPRQWATAFPNISKEAATAGQYFYVPTGADGMLNLATLARMVRTGTENAALKNIERGVMPDTLVIDRDLFDFSSLEQRHLDGYKRPIVIKGLAHNRAPGGLCRPTNLDPNLYNTPYTKDLGDKSGPLSFPYDPVIGPYWDWCEHYSNAQGWTSTEATTGERVRMNGKYISNPYEFLYGNYLVQKMWQSNIEANMDQAGERKYLPVLTGYHGDYVIPTYAVEFSKEDADYIWDGSGGPLVSFETLFETVYVETFGLYGLDGNGNHIGNAFVVVNPINIQPVYPNDVYNWCLSQQYPTLELRIKLQYPCTHVTDFAPSVSERMMTEARKKAY